VKRVLVYGPRKWRWPLFIYIKMLRLRQEIGDYVVVSGLANGADSHGVWAAELLGLEVEGYRPNWNKYHQGAGFIRNQEMLDSGIDIALGFGSGAGTNDMRDRLRLGGVETRHYWGHKP
jgi:hypothetical protein